MKIIFAAGVDRESFERVRMLDYGFNEIMEETITAMREVSEEIGL